jgi:hydrogenase expression/formation protein HypC
MAGLLSARSSRERGSVGLSPQIQIRKASGMCLAVPGKILSVAGEDPLQRSGRVSFGGIVKEVNLSCVPEAKIGDYVIVHVGLAISTLDEEEAHRVLEYIREMGELAELEETDAPNKTRDAAPTGSALET